MELTWPRDIGISRYSFSLLSPGRIRHRLRSGVFDTPLLLAPYRWRGSVELRALSSAFASDRAIASAISRLSAQLSLTGTWVEMPWGYYDGDSLNILPGRLIDETTAVFAQTDSAVWRANVSNGGLNPLPVGSDFRGFSYAPGQASGQMPWLVNMSSSTPSHIPQSLEINGTALTFVRQGQSSIPAASEPLTSEWGFTGFDAPGVGTPYTIKLGYTDGSFQLFGDPNTAIPNPPIPPVTWRGTIATVVSDSSVPDSHGKITVTRTAGFPGIVSVDDWLTVQRIGTNATIQVTKTLTSNSGNTQTIEYIPGEQFDIGTPLTPAFTMPITFPATGEDAIETNWGADFAGPWVIDWEEYR